MIGASVQSMPLVGGEIQRIHDAFHRVSLELSGVVTALSELHVDTVGTPGCDPAVQTGMNDLRTALSGLQHVSADCQLALARHGDLETEPATTPTSDAVEAGPDEAGSHGSRI